MLEIHCSHFSQLGKKQRKSMKRKIQKALLERSRNMKGLYQQTLTAKMQPLPMKERFCPHYLPNNLRYIKRDLCNQNNTPRRIFQAVLVICNYCSHNFLIKHLHINYLLEVKLHQNFSISSTRFLFLVLQRSSFVKPGCSVAQENSKVPNHQMRKAFAKTRSVCSTLHSSLKIVLKSNICCI